MKKISVVVASLLVVGLMLPVMAGGDECHCKGMTAASVGWCDSCKHGTAFGHEIKSKKLTEALMGTKVDEAAMKCDGCKAAMKSNGHCDHCKTHFAHGMMYKSHVAHMLAHGKVMAADEIKCDGCKTNLTGKKSAFCDKCNAGMVCGMVYMSKADFDGAMKAEEALKAAAAVDCEDCAVAMVTDGECSHCKKTFKDGKEAPAAAHPAGGH